jgi:RNA methyltransferase, TrmH family
VDDLVAQFDVAQFDTARHDPALAVLEGFHALKHAIRFGAKIRMAVGTDLRALDELCTALAPDIRAELLDNTRQVDREVFRQLGKNPPHTEVLAIAERRIFAAGQLIDSTSIEPLVLLEDPRHLGNLGAVIRVSAAADVAGVLVTGDVDPWDPSAIRGSAGLHYAVPVARIDRLPATDRPLIAMDPDGLPMAGSAIPDRAILAFGSERHGLSGSLLSRADSRLRIPMRPGVSSLNLATSVAVALFWRRLAGTATGSLAGRQT